jgi:simple sugar transport system ATP-binding protein
VVSQDLDELFEIADRIAVMFAGKLSKPVITASASRETLGLLMGGSEVPAEAPHAGA